MASIPLAANNLRIPEQPNALDQYARIMQIKSAQQNQQIQQQEIQKNQQAIKDQQAHTAAMKQWDAKSDPNGDSLPDLIIKNGGSGDAALNLKKSILAQKEQFSTIAKNDAETGSKNIETLKQKNDIALGAIKTADDIPDEQLAGHLGQTIQALTQQGTIDQQHAQMGAQLVQALQGGQITPQQARDQLKIYEKGLQSNSQQITQAKDQAETAKNNAQAGEATAQTNKINAEINPDNPANPDIRKQKYESILQKVQQGGISSISPVDLSFARSYELGQQKTTTQSDSLGVTSTNTSRPSGLAGASGGRSAAPAAGAGNGGSAPSQPNNVKDSLVDAIGQYKYNPMLLNRLAVKHPEILASVTQKYPDWSQPNYNAANKAVTDLAPSGKTGSQLTSYNTFLRHAGALYDAVDSLDNSKYSDLLNKPMNWIAKHTGDPRVADFMAAMQPPMKEFQAFLLNNHAMHTEDVKDAHALIDENKTPQEIRAVLKRFAETGSARLSEQNESFKRVTGRDIPNLVSPEAAKAYNKITGQGGGGKISVTAPDGSVHPFDTQAQADAFKKLAHIQ